MSFGAFSKDGETVHDWARERMSPYMDGQLSPTEAAQLETHIESCAECADELRALRTTRQLLRTMPSVRLPRAFTLEAAPRRQALPRLFYFLRTATAVTAAVFVALLAASVVLPVSGWAPASAPAALRAAQPAVTAPAAAPAAGSQAPQRAAPAAAESKAAPAAQAPAPVPQAPAAAPAPAVGSAQAAPTPRPSVPGQASAPTAHATVPSAAGSTAADSSNALPKASSAAEPSPSTHEPARSSAAVQSEKLGQPPTGPDRGTLSHLLLPFQLAAAGLAVIFALASSTIWWIHRRRRP